ncbi:MAG TPA: hypothetical protein PLR06_09295 [Cyclobacteriaceae bacterium]|nr:hypothetical protein [Cyclobacteriaceae bacterium]
MNISLSTYYGGLTLKNPIVIGSSNIVTDVENLEKLEEAGAGAIVYKSLFEEQIEIESLQMDQMNESYSNWDAEHTTFFPSAQHAGPTEQRLTQIFSSFGACITLSYPNFFTNAGTTSFLYFSCNLGVYLSVLII